MNIDALERELEAKKQQGLALVTSTMATAERENREITEPERAAIQAVTDEGLALKSRISRAKGDQSMLASIEQLTAGAGPARNGGAPPKPGRLLSMGDQFVQSPNYEFFRSGGHRGPSAWRSPTFDLDPHWDALGGMPGMRAATLTEDPASGGALVIPQYLPGILPLQYKRLTVADLFAAGTTDSNRVVYMKEATFVNAANTVLEGAAKPESTLTFTATGDDVRKIAHWLPVSEEMLEDVAQIRSYIDARLRLGVMIEEEDQLLNGTGVAPDILGLLLRPGLAADVARVDPATNADAIFAQIMAIYASSFLMPDGVIMHPTNWARTLLTKTTTGEYLAGGPFQSIPTPTLWGLPVAVTPSIALNTAMVGAYKTGGQVFRRGGIRVEASNSHADYFIKNLVAIRAEERLALAIYRPGAFGEVTGLTP